MLKNRIVEEDGLIVTRFSGTHTYKDAVQALDAILAINRGHSEIYEIVINEDDLRLEFIEEELKLLNARVVSTFGNFERGGLAVVSNIDFIFGMTRMLESTVKNESIAIAVFRTEKLAREWILEIRGLHGGQSHQNQALN